MTIKSEIVQASLFGLGIGFAYFIIFSFIGSNDYVFTPCFTGISAAVMLFLSEGKGFKGLFRYIYIYDVVAVVMVLVIYFVQGIKNGVALAPLFLQTLGGAMFMLDGAVLMRKFFRQGK